jgi:phage recombination protein Bet
MSVNAVAKLGSTLEVLPTTNAQVVSADEWNDRRIQFIRDNFANGAPGPEFDAFIQICKRRGLSPEEKQIYLIPRKGKWTPQTSIDGSRLIAERSGVYAGSDEAVFEESGQRLLNGNGKPYPLKATVTVWKIVAGVRCPFTSSAHWDEYNSGENLWITMPHVMLAKCAESQALRKAFPADLSGLYTVEEMGQADRDDRPRASVKAAPAKPATGKVPAAIESGKPLSWTELWRLLAARNIDAATYESIVGVAAKTYRTAQEALDALAEADNQIQGGDEDDQTIDGEYVDADGVIS